MQPMHISLRLRADRSKLETDLTLAHALLQLNEALGADVLQRMLQAGDQVGHELGDRAGLTRGSISSNS